ncbi:MAG: hypothetical protein AB8H79_18940 [Myxococcota bacterium]
MRLIAIIMLLASIMGDGCVCRGGGGSHADRDGGRGDERAGAGGGGGSLGTGGSNASSSKCTGSAPAPGDATVHELGGGTYEDRLFGRRTATVDVPAKGENPCP